MIKRFLALAAVVAMMMPAAAQVSVKWGNTDTRYPVNAADAVRTSSVSSATAWKGERVNFQLAVTNKNEAGDSCSVAYRFSELKNGKSVIPATNVVGGFVQPVITDRFTGCGKHEVDAYGENLVADRITDTNPTVLPGGSLRGLWLTVQVPQDAKPGKVFKNTKNLKLSFDLERTSDFSSNNNISFREYLNAKTDTLNNYLKNIDQYANAGTQVAHSWYLRSDFTNWGNDDNHILTEEDGFFVYRLVTNQTCRFKIYNNTTSRWYGAERIDAGCTVPYEADGHTNIVLQAGTYLIRIHPETHTIYLEMEK